RLERASHAVVIEHIGPLIQRAKACLMRHQLCKRDPFFASMCKFRPELCYESIELNIVFLQSVQNTRAADSLRGRPDQNKCVARPRVFAMAIAKSAAKIDDRSGILPNRYRHPQLTKPLEV